MTSSTTTCRRMVVVRASKIRERRLTMPPFLVSAPLRSRLRGGTSIPSLLLLVYSKHGYFLPCLLTCSLSMNLVYTLNENQGRLVIHDGVEIVTADMFNKSLRRSVIEIVLGKDVKRLEERAFQGWTLLKKVQCNNSLEYIGAAAFNRGSLLKGVKFGTNLSPWF